MQQLTQFFLIELPDGLPEPLNNLIILIIGSLILSIFLPVIHINKGHSVQDHLQLIGIEH
jgi:hypothetical protein